MRIRSNSFDSTLMHKRDSNNLRKSAYVPTRREETIKALSDTRYLWNAPFVVLHEIESFMNLPDDRAHKIKRNESVFKENEDFNIILSICKLLYLEHIHGRERSICKRKCGKNELRSVLSYLLKKLQYTSLKLIRRGYMDLKYPGLNSDLKKMFDDLVFKELTKNRIYEWLEDSDSEVMELEPLRARCSIS